MKAEIFTSPTCVKCKSLKTQLENENYDNLTIEFIDITTPEGMDKAKEKGVTGLPTACLYDDDDSEMGHAHDIDEIEEILGQ